MNGANGYSKPKTDLEKMIQEAIEKRLPAEVTKALADRAKDAEKKGRRARNLAAGQLAHQTREAERVTGTTLEASLQWLRDNGFDV
jgi:hypothetical protein